MLYGERLDFLDEDLKKKEILLFLMNPNSRGPHIDLLRSFGSLELDPGLAANYIQALLNDASLPFVEEEIDELYTEVTNVRERLEFLGIMEMNRILLSKTMSGRSVRICTVAGSKALTSDNGCR